MNRYAMIDGNAVVLNVCVWDSVTPWNPQPGTASVVKLLPDEPCGPGWVYNSSSTPRFSEPENT